MFQGLSYNEQPSFGKRMHGFTAKKEPGFSLNWDQSHQLNSYQIRKGRDQEVTGKITHTGRPVSHQPPAQYDEALEREKMRQLYQKITYQNPDIPSEELERYMQGYEQQQRAARGSQQQQQQPQNAYERRVPIRQKQSMKDIIFNNVGSETTEQQRAASRRNSSNMVLGGDRNYPDNYNYR